ncbi:Phosphatase methylesterase 1 [Fulvia fulva]|uniref:Protein phosphatase methylesterase 1 n=1 Tax=Passalora fulva TaxID=5499 RepID=A0A9Q8P6R0_PASFU|nr:Phosphatase methylesterase 1 [Fulvia fulva]KAK4629358.1 Phosphatase methylesterase 1 [Fulvia fulva]KAK4629839.1 Phosphatase methylesterase 1 [Fulvia fulva]UJO15211.1 Phosphatase methylesterase 1 [Fulvia fulva]WPV12380.1 Phosphatase methylesterase 1 [Fulvia fulva]WPV27300.1 Phosphatase methylesterase 1 [Fulvia fulva]
MSGLFKQSVNGAAPPNEHLRPPPMPIATPQHGDVDDYPSSDSSASSAATVDTIRPSSREQAAPATHWTNFFDQELYLEEVTGEQKAVYHAYLTLPIDLKKDPLFICHHGAGASGLSFAIFAQQIRARLPTAGILSLEARAHGSVVTNMETQEEVIDYSLATMTNDAVSMIKLTASTLGWDSLPPTVLLGHSLGGAIVTTLATDHFKVFGSSFIGYSVIDVVEGSAIEALGHMKTYLSSRPSMFSSIEDAVTWHIRSRSIRDHPSAEASVPSLLIPSPSGNGKLIWRTNLDATNPWWEEWFTGMSKKFLSGRGAKQLILAGTDRLDKDLMIGQMQGKFQLVVIPEAGHFVQEDVPEKTANLLIEFFKRNDRSQMVLPPKVSDLIAQGKKV